MLFEFNQYSTPLLIGFLQGVVYAALFLWRAIQKERLSDALFGAILFTGCLAIAQWMLGYANWYDAHDWRTTVMFYMPWHHPFLFGPLIYLYFLSVSNRSLTSLWPYRWHFLPFALVLLQPLAVFLYDIVWVHWIQGEPLVYFYHTRGDWAQYLNSTSNPLFLILYIADKLHVISYLVLAIIAYRNYRSYLRAHFSNEDQRAFSWLRNVLYLLIVGIGVFELTGLINQFLPLDYGQYWNAYMALAAAIYVLSIYVFHATSVLPEDVRFSPNLSLIPSSQESPSVQVDAELSEWTARLQQFMQSEKPYLDADLTLSDLAERLRTNTSTLSRVINTGLGQNFNDFINTYRVRAFIEEVRQGRHLQQTLLSIALDCGFNSKATFNRSFRKLEGKSPREFISGLNS